MNINTDGQYETELEFVNDFELFLNKSSNENFGRIREFEGGFGRPDILLHSLPVLDASLDIQTLARINPRLAPLLATGIAAKIRSIEDLRIATGTTLKNARLIARELQTLERLTYKLGSRDLFQIKHIKQPPFQHTVSIEAKLRDWRRALIQAYRYTQFSNESWVLIDDKHVKPALDNSKLFRAYGIGLASFSKNRSLYIQIKAKYRKRSNSSLAWRTQALLSQSILKN
jgi:hypothetical protein